MATLRVLSIDAWRDPDGWTWNAWYCAGSIALADFERIADKPRSLLAWFRNAGMLSASSAGRVAIDDDGFNVVILARGTQEPLFAIEYGPAY